MAHTWAHWASCAVKAEGKRLVFDVEPSGCSDFDTLTCETLESAFHAIEMQVDEFEPTERKAKYEIVARWVTEEEWTREQAEWVNDAA